MVNENNASSQNKTIKQEVIEIDSDSEDDEDYYDPDLYHFAKKVTKPWENRLTSQMMVSYTYTTTFIFNFSNSNH